EGWAAALPRGRPGRQRLPDRGRPGDRALRRDVRQGPQGEEDHLHGAGPSGDYDNDGRLDLFLPNWWADSRSLLLRNETSGGNFLQVQVEGTKGVNRMGIGARVNVYSAGKLGRPGALLGCREIATGYGYASGQPAIAHFGLGKETSVDVEVVLP